MGARDAQQTRKLWRLIRRQHGVVSADQVLAAGLTRKGIHHRLRSGRLHLLMPGVYAVGRPRVSRKGWWMAAVLRCGEGSAISHASAAYAWGILPFAAGPTDVSVPVPRQPREPLLRIHRRSPFPSPQIRQRFAIPTTSPALTIVDLAPGLSLGELERAVDKAVGNELLTPGTLRSCLNSSLSHLAGVRILRRLLDRDEFVLTESELERLFVPIALSAGLPPPQTQVHLNGHRVDFFWPDLGLVVETDSLRWHRTAAAQARDLARDQDHVRGGLSVLRFSHSQVRYEPGHVRQVLAEVASRLRLS